MMLGSIVRIVRRRLAAALAGVVMGGVALAQDTLPRAAPPPTTMPASSIAGASPSPAAASPAPQLSAARLDQLVAPIALYPDPLLAQILMASTYPLEVVEAARWVAVPANQALQGDALVQAIAAQDWDPSVKALVAFPTVLETMSDRLQWTQDLGNAFLVQQAEVMAAVQRLRHQAVAAGTLKTTPQCDCTVTENGDTVAIEPAEPEEVRVPVYNPSAYGPWSYPDYPADWFPPPAGFDFLPGFTVGYEPPADLAFFGPLWGWCWIDWGPRVILVRSRRPRLFVGDRHSIPARVWAHDPAHRGGVRYADAATRARFDTARRAGVTMAARIDAVAAATASTRPDDAGRFVTLRNEAARQWAQRPGAPTVLRGTVPIIRRPAAFQGLGMPIAHVWPAVGFGSTVFRGFPALHIGGVPHLAPAGPHGGAPGGHAR
jgi:Protein of unknown function (DUF3300)